MGENHPLDIELFDYAVGALDDRANAAIAEHLDDCLLCRVRVARIRRHHPSQGAFPSPHISVDVSPGVQAAVSGNADPEEVAVGQVWLAGGPRRTLVWVRAVHDGWVICHPATIEAEIADDSTLIVENFEPLGQPLAVMTSIAGTVLNDKLMSFVGVLDVAEDVNRLRDAAQTGVSAQVGWPTGPPIAGPADERLMLRQMLADELVALNPIEEDTDDTAVPAHHGRRAHPRAHLRFSKGCATATSSTTA